MYEQPVADNSEKLRAIEARMAVEDRIANDPNMTEDEAQVLRDRNTYQTNYPGMSEIGKKYADQLNTASEQALGGSAIRSLTPEELVAHDAYASRPNVTQEQADEYKQQLLSR